MTVFLKVEIFESTLNIQRKVKQSIVVIFMTDRQTDNWQKRQYGDDRTKECEKCLFFSLNVLILSLSLKVL
jgi:hypothetical protein